MGLGGSLLLPFLRPHPLPPYPQTSINSSPYSQRQFLLWGHVLDLWPRGNHICCLSFNCLTGSPSSYLSQQRRLQGVCPALEMETVIPPLPYKMELRMFSFQGYREN